VKFRRKPQPITVREERGMKHLFKTLLFAMVIFVISQPASAQLMGIGVKGGVNFSNISGSFFVEDEDIEIGDLKYKTGLILGASYNIPLLPTVSFQPEILYASKGGKFEESISFEGESLNFEGSIDLTYIEVPLLVKLHLPTPGMIPNFYLGPAIGFRSAAKAKFEYSGSFMGIPFSESFEEDIKEEVKSTDFGLVLGAGIEFPLTAFNLTADLRYTMGLSSIAEDEDLDLKNKAITFMIGVVF
jgi:hypothetical protein